MTTFYLQQYGLDRILANRPELEKELVAKITAAGATPIYDNDRGEGVQGTLLGVSGNFTNDQLLHALTNDDGFYKAFKEDVQREGITNPNVTPGDLEAQAKAFNAGTPGGALYDLRGVQDTRGSTVSGINKVANTVLPAAILGLGGAGAMGLLGGGAGAATAAGEIGSAVAPAAAATTVPSIAPTAAQLALTPEAIAASMPALPEISIANAVVPAAAAATGAAAGAGAGTPAATTLTPAQTAAATAAGTTAASTAIKGVTDAGGGVTVDDYGNVVTGGQFTGGTIPADIQAIIKDLEPGVLDSIAAKLGMKTADLLKLGATALGGLIGAFGNKPGAIATNTTTNVLPEAQPYVKEALDAAKQTYINSATNLPQLTDYTPTLTDKYIGAAIAAAQQPTWDQLKWNVLPKLTGGAIASGQAGSSRQAIQNTMAINTATRNANDIGATMWQNFAPLQAADKQAATASHNTNQTALWNAPQTAISNAVNNLMSIAGGGKTSSANTQLPATPWWQTAVGGAISANGLYNKMTGTVA